MLVLIIFIYIIIFTLSFFRYSKKTIFTVYLFLGIILVLLATFRDGNSVRDYNNYLESFQNNGEGLEISFKLITSFVKQIFTDELFLFFIYACLGVITKLIAMKKLSKFFLLSLLIYYSNFYLLQELTQIRAGVASGFFLLSLPYLRQRELLKFSFFIFIATLFHYSAIIYFFIYFLDVKRINLKIWLCLIPISYFLYVFNINFTTLLSLIRLEHISDKINIYIALTENEERTRNVFNSLQLLRIFIVYVFIWKFELINNYLSEFTIFLKIYIIGIISLPLFIEIPDIAVRVSELFLIIEIILIPYLYYVCKQKYISLFFIYFTSFIFLYTNLFYASLVK